MKVVAAVLCLAALLVAGCNAPPGYSKTAEKILGEQGYSPDFIKQLTWHRPLPEAELRQLAAIDNIAVLHLVGANPNTPPDLLETLAKHPSFEVHTGVVSNPNAPLELLMGMRTEGKYSTVNATMSRNAQIPAPILQEMWDQGEVADWGIASNPNCPSGILEEILDGSTDTALAAMARNPKLSDAMIERLDAQSEMVRYNLSSNPVYLDWQARQVN
jgi:hypothetical protein